MRISTQSFYEQSQAAMSTQQANLLRVQQQIGANTKILAPSDDPIAATRALATAQAISLNGQYASSRNQVKQTLSLEGNILDSVTNIYNNIKSLVVQGGNGSLSDSDRASIAIVCGPTPVSIRQSKYSCALLTFRLPLVQGDPSERLHRSDSPSNKSETVFRISQRIGSCS